MPIRVKCFVASSKTHDIGCTSLFVFSRSTESPNQLATVPTSTTPHTNPWLPDAEMNRLAPCTFGLPPGCMLNRHWDTGLPCWIAHKLKRQRHTGHTPTAVSAQTLRTLVCVVRLLSDRACHLSHTNPVLHLHRSLARTESQTVRLVREASSGHGCPGSAQDCIGHEAQSVDRVRLWSQCLDQHSRPAG